MQWFLVLLGYVIGSFPTAYVFGQRFKGKDIRRLGDGNMGARNAYHELGHKIGILIFCIDAAKGSLAIVLAQAFGAPQYIVMLTGLCSQFGRLAGLESGANDFLTKPFKAEELVSKVDKLLRGQTPSKSRSKSEPELNGSRRKQEARRQLVEL